MLFWPGQTSKKWYYQLMENFDVYLHAKKSPSLLASFLRYRKDIANLSEYFGHTWHKPSKRKYQLVENFDIYQYAKNQPHQSRLSWDNVNNSLGMPGHTHQIRQYQLVENWCLSAQKSNIIPHFFLEILQRFCKTCYSGHFGHDWLSPPTLILSTCRKVRCLPGCKKLTSFLCFFLKYC